MSRRYLSAIITTIFHILITVILYMIFRNESVNISALSLFGLFFSVNLLIVHIGLNWDILSNMKYNVNNKPNTQDEEFLRATDIYNRRLQDIDNKLEKIRIGIEDILEVEDMMLEEESSLDSKSNETSEDKVIFEPNDEYIEIMTEIRDGLVAIFAEVKKNEKKQTKRMSHITKMLSKISNDTDSIIKKNENFFALDDE